MNSTHTADHPTTLDTTPVEATAPQSPAVHPPAPRQLGPIVLYGLVVLVAWAGLEFWGLGRAPFHTKGEPREALVVWEMTHGGGWVLPKRNGVELPSKPPLFHWLGAVTSLLHGATDEWSIRFPSAALSLLSLLCVFAAGVALWNARAGVIAALALMTTFEWARAATNARVDMTLTFGLEAAFLSLLFFLRHRTRGWLVPLYIGITLAVLGKGPVGAVLPGLVALVMFALARDFSPLRDMRLAMGVLIVAVGAGSWYVMALIQGGIAFFRKQVLAENLFTFLNDAQFGGGHRHPVTYLFGALLLGLLPWTVFLPAVAARLWRGRREVTMHDGRPYLLVWIAVVFAFYGLAASKRSVYLLALYPAVALLLGWWWDDRSRTASGEDRWLARVVAFVSWLLITLLLVLLAAVLLENAGVRLLSTIGQWLPEQARALVPAISNAMQADHWLLLGLLVAALVALYACVLVARTAWWLGIFGAVFSAVAALMLAVRLVLLPAVAEHLTFRPFMADVREVVGPDGNVSFYKTFQYGAVFYWGGHIGSYDGPLSNGPRYLLMTAAEWKEVGAAGRMNYERVRIRDAENGRESQRLVLVRRTQAQ